jgi:hypothetical protein
MLTPMEGEGETLPVPLSLLLGVSVAEALALHVVDSLLVAVSAALLDREAVALRLALGLTEADGVAVSDELPLPELELVTLPDCGGVPLPLALCIGAGRRHGECTHCCQVQMHTAEGRQTAACREGSTARTHHRSRLRRRNGA